MGTTPSETPARAAFPVRGVALPALSGAVMTLAAPPLSFVPVAFAGLVPLLLWIDRPMPARELVRGSVAFGFLFVLGQGWSIFALARYSAVGIAIGAVAVLMLVATWFLMPIALNLLNWTRPVPLALAAPVLWVAGEQARGFGDLAIPYIVLGHLLAPYPRLIQAADLVGTSGLSAWIVLVNALLARAIVQRRDRRGLAWTTLALAATLALPLGYGALRWNALEARLARAESVPVAIVQPNVEQHLKWDPASIPSVFDRVNRLIETAEADGPRLVVGPESCLPVLTTTSAARLPGRLRPGGVPVLLGAIAGIGEGTPQRGGGARFMHYDRHHNSAFLAGADRMILGRYDKRALVPMGEKIPFGPLLHPLSLLIEGRFGEFEPGSTDQILDIPGPGPAARAGVLICYEAVFPRLVAATRADGADFLVNITNDAWFGRSSFAWLFAEVCALRAVENRCSVVRAANTGISVVYDPLGRVRGATPIGEEAILRADVPLLREGTLATRFGDWFACLAWIATGGLLLRAWIAYRKASALKKGTGTFSE